MGRTLARKTRASDRPRPHILQMLTAFTRSLHSKRAKGDKRQDSTMMAAIIKECNQVQTAKQRLTSDKRDLLLAWSVKGLPDHVEGALEELTGQVFRCSGVLLAKPFLSNSYEPPVRRATHPNMYAALSGSPEKREAWLARCIGKYVKHWHDSRAPGKQVNISSLGTAFRGGN